MLQPVFFKLIGPLAENVILLQEHGGEARLDPSFFWPLRTVRVQHPEYGYVRQPLGLAMLVDGQHRLNEIAVPDVGRLEEVVHRLHISRLEAARVVGDHLLVVGMMSAKVPGKNPAAVEGRFPAIQSAEKIVDGARPGDVRNPKQRAQDVGVLRPGLWILKEALEPFAHLDEAAFAGIEPREFERNAVVGKRKAPAMEQLDGEDYDRGSVETAAATADNNSCAIGRLLDILLNGNRITLDEVRIILGYGEDVTLEKIK